MKNNKILSNKLNKNNNLIYTIIKIIIIFVIIILIIFFTIFLVGYYSGSCYKNFVKDNYECDKNFCLIKKLKINIPNHLKKDIFVLINDESNKKRVVIKPLMNIESIFNCAIPSKAGSTITAQIINDKIPQLINYYQNELCNIISKSINIKLKPTSLKYPTTCCILLYEKEGDWINWHYDYNYYNGRFFTVLILLNKDITCSKYQYKIDNTINQLDLIEDAVIFEGNYLYHNASKLCNNEKRYVLSLQYVTDDKISFLNSLRIKIKDYAYIGMLK